MFVTTATSREEAERNADVAVLPIGSFEQHGTHLPLATDRLLAGSSGFGPAWRVDGGKIVSLTA